jgi:hypothetical protein
MLATHAHSTPSVARQTAQAVASGEALLSQVGQTGEKMLKSILTDAQDDPPTPQSLLRKAQKNAAAEQAASSEPEDSTNQGKLMMAGLVEGGKNMLQSLLIERNVEHTRHEQDVASAKEEMLEENTPETTAVQTFTDDGLGLVVDRKTGKQIGSRQSRQARQATAGKKHKKKQEELEFDRTDPEAWAIATKSSSKKRKEFERTDPKALKALETKSWSSTIDESSSYGRPKDWIEAANKKQQFKRPKSALHLLHKAINKKHGGNKKQEFKRTHWMAKSLRLTRSTTDPASWKKAERNLRKHYHVSKAQAAKEKGDRADQEAIQEDGVPEMEMEDDKADPLLKAGRLPDGTRPDGGLAMIRELDEDIPVDEEEERKYGMQSTVTDDVEIDAEVLKADTELAYGDGEGSEAGSMKPSELYETTPDALLLEQRVEQNAELDTLRDEDDEEDNAAAKKAVLPINVANHEPLTEKTFSSKTAASRPTPQSLLKKAQEKAAAAAAASSSEPAAIAVSEPSDEQPPVQTDSDLLEALLADRKAVQDRHEELVGAKEEMEAEAKAAKPIRAHIFRTSDGKVVGAEEEMQAEADADKSSKLVRTSGGIHQMEKLADEEEESATAEKSDSDSSLASSVPVESVEATAAKEDKEDSEETADPEEADLPRGIEVGHDEVLNYVEMIVCFALLCAVAVWFCTGCRMECLQWINWRDRETLKNVYSEIQTPHAKGVITIEQAATPRAHFKQPAVAPATAADQV